MELPISGNIEDVTKTVMDAVEAGDVIGLTMAVIVVVPAICIGILKIYDGLGSVRRSNGEDQRVRFENLISSLKNGSSSIHSLQLEEAFRNYYNYSISAAEIRSLIDKNYASQAVHDYKRVKKYIKYIKAKNSGVTFRWKKKRHRYNFRIFSIKLTLQQILYLSAYLFFASMAAILSKNVLENYDTHILGKYDFVTFVTIVFSFMYLAIVPLLEAVKYRDAEVFIKEYGLRSFSEIEKKYN